MPPSHVHKDHDTRLSCDLHARPVADMLRSVQDDYSQFRHGMLEKGWPAQVTALAIMGMALTIADVFCHPIIQGRAVFPLDSVLSYFQIWFHVAMAYLVYLFYQAYKLGPGYPPIDWTADGAPECKHCHKPKPPRTHHCKVCKRCVLQMDHHCPWINNCVGYRNQKIYVQFLILATMQILGTIVYMLFHVYFCTSIPFLSGPDPKHCLGVGPWTRGFIFVMLVLYIISGGLIGALMVTQFWNVLTNTTSIEGVQCAGGRAKAKRRGEMWMHPYDYGAWRNFKLVFGDMAPIFFMPTTPSVRRGYCMGGTNYPVRPDYWDWVKSLRDGETRGMPTPNTQTV